MANSVMELLDMLYEMIDDAKGGLGGFCKIERDKALDILPLHAVFFLQPELI